jgi:hypothetical protein
MIGSVSAPTRRDVWTWIRSLLFLAGLAVLIVIMIRLGVDRVLELIASAGGTLALIPIVYAGCQLTRAAALWLCLPPESAVPYRDVLAARVSAEAVRLVTFTGPLVAEPSKLWLLGRRGLPPKVGVAAIVAEILAHSLMATVISIAAFAYLLAAEFPLTPAVRGGGLVLLCGASLYVVVAVTAIWRRVYMIGAGTGVLQRMGLLRFVQDHDVREMEDLLLAVFHDRPARLRRVVSYHLLANLCLMLEIVVALDAMGLTLPVLQAVVIEGALKFVSVVFFFIPAQVGASEGTSALLFETLGIGAAVGVSFALIRRLRTLAVASVGFVVLSVLGLR